MVVSYTSDPDIQNGKKFMAQGMQIAAGVPLTDDEPIILDVSMATIAEGKIRVAFNKGVPVPDNCIIDSTGQPTNGRADARRHPPTVPWI